MKLTNQTRYDVEALLAKCVSDIPTSGLIVEIKYSPATSQRFISGTYYRACPKHPEGKFIRLRINPHNRYPLEIPFKTSQYTRKTNSNGDTLVYQKIDKIRFKRAEELILAIFLHEFSHYLDHIEGRNGRYKQTKADKFAIERLKAAGLA